jgi:sortase (surface protein transpeptidase)
VDALAGRLRARLLPALLTALGVVLLATGLLTYTGPVEAGPEPTDPPATLTPLPTTGPALSPEPSLEPSAGPSATIPSDRVATRVVIAALGIDLPVIKQVDSKPACGVAMYWPDLSQPGNQGATYLYAHAQTGMFLPLLEASKIADGAAMLGMIVEVYTSDDQLFLYEIDQVRRHVPYDEGFDDPYAATDAELWLQTSEGVGQQPKLQIVARFLSTGPADHDVAHPVPSPRACG